MVLSTNEAYSYQSHAIGGGEVPQELDRQQILNRSLDFLYGMHPWKWSIERTALLNTRGRITITDGDWTEASLTLNSVGAFTDYDFVGGDQLEVEGGTGVTTGFYEIDSRTGNDDIVLKRSISTANIDLSNTDIEVRITLPTVGMPTDFRDIIDISATDALLYGLRLTSLSQILRNRTSQIDVTTSWNFQGAIVYSGSPPVPILELWPNPTTTQEGVFTMFYRRKWERVTGDNTVVDVPEYIEMLAIETIMAYAEGIVRRGDGTTNQRLQEVAQGPVFQKAIEQDGLTQPTFGRLRGSGAAIHARQGSIRRYWALLNQPVNAPN